MTAPVKSFEGSNRVRAPRSSADEIPARISPYFDLKRDPSGREYMEVAVTGIALLRLVLTNKGTAFTHDERVELGLDGLLPPSVENMEEQINRVYRGFQEAPSPIARYQYLRQLQERQEILFYALLERHISEMLPIVYTPTVGQAVQEFNALYESPRGISLSTVNSSRAPRVLENYPLEDVRMIVATDSSAILGIGDQGYGGLAIPIGKLALYTIAGGVSPFHTMPVALDVGTDRMDLILDPTYLGVRQRRLTGEPYLEFVDQFVEAVRARWPRAVIQWEDLAKETAFTVLERFRDVVPSFNDDIQGTGAVALAGVISACHLKGEKLSDQRMIVYGAGAGGVGVALALRDGLMREGLSAAEATERLFVLDSKGLLTESRPMESYKRQFAQPDARLGGWKCAGRVPTLLETIENSGAGVLLGLSGQPGTFTADIVRAVAANTPRPVIYPLSNPTASCEAQPSDILSWTNGAAIVATGSPFADVERDGARYPIGQGNNAFIFPGLGFGAILCGATKITDGMVSAAAYALADYTVKRYVPEGLVYPPIDDLRETSVRVTAAVIAQAVTDGVAGSSAVPDTDVEEYVRAQFWRPRYLPFVRAPSVERRGTARTPSVVPPPGGPRKAGG
jgi:malate dehydrogenase (oxaloacetate-decarboxylating)